MQKIRMPKRIAAFILAMLLISSVISQDIYAYAAPLVASDNIEVFDEDAEYETSEDIDNNSENKGGFSEDQLKSDNSDINEVEAKAFEENITEAETEIEIETEDSRLDEETSDETESEEADSLESQEDTTVQDDEVIVYSDENQITSGDYTYVLDGDNAILTGYTGTDTEVTIPSSIDEYAVTKLNGTFNENKTIIKVIIPDTVTRIEKYTFYKCISLKTVELPDTVKYIGILCFNGCSDLEAVQLPAQIETIGEKAFYGCNKINSLIIPKSTEKIGMNSFKGISEIVFEDGIEAIPVNACYGNDKLINVVIPDTVKSIGNSAFKNCSSLESVQIPELVSELYNDTFYGCSSLESINIPDGVTAIGNYCFYACSKLEKIIVPNSVEKIGNRAFSRCDNLNDITISNDTLFEVDVFGGRKLEGSCGENVKYEIDFSNRTLLISGSGSMSDYSKDNPAPWSMYKGVIKDVIFEGDITSIGAYSFYSMNIPYLPVPKGIKTIGEGAFENCEQLEFIDLPDTITEVGSYAFLGCTNLKDIVFSGNAPLLGTDIISKSFNTSIFYPETASGWNDRFVGSYSNYGWEKYDNTSGTIDVVLLIDTSESMKESMIDLKNTVASFISQSCKVQNSMRISLVQYNSNASVICGFTNDRATLMTHVFKLKSTGSTEYIKALKTADEEFRFSRADNKVIVLFSDGAPTDSKSEIYALAESLRQKYTIFAVGLGNVNTDILENVTGSALKVFFAKSIDELVSAFNHLSENIKKNDTTKITIKRNNYRYNLYTGPMQKFCKNSDEYVEIYVEPSINCNPAKYIIKQGDKEIATSSTGNFLDIKPGKNFGKDGDITLSMYDAEGNIIDFPYSLKIKIVEKFTVKFMIPEDGIWKVYNTQTIADLSDLEQPNTPVCEGKVFQGWYGNGKYAGEKFLFGKNALKRYYIDGNLILYGKWMSFDKETFDWKKDKWGFSNSPSVFCGDDYFDNPDKYKYEMTYSDRLLFMAQYVGAIHTVAMLVQSTSNWGGSCFGMSATSVLAKVGAIDISDYDPSKHYPGQVTSLRLNKPDELPDNIESLINYYQSCQLATLMEPNVLYDTYKPELRSKNIESIIKKFKSTDYPLVVGLKVEGIGGHAVVGFDFKEIVADEEYSFKVYDCSNSDEPFEVILKKNSSGEFISECDEWAAAWDKYNEDGSLKQKASIFLTNANTVEDIKFGILPPALSGTYKSDAIVTYALNTNYDSFSITDGETTGIVENGQIKEAGNILIDAYGNVAMADALDDSYRFSLKGIPSEKTYKIQPLSSDKSVFRTMIIFEDKGSYIETDKAADIDIAPEGIVRVSSKSEVKQNIVVVDETLKTPWKSLNISGKNYGFIVDLNRTEPVISSILGSTMNLTVSDGVNEISFDNVNVSSSVKVGSDENRNCILSNSASGEEIAIKNFGHIVIFNSNGGNSLPAKKAVISGSKIDAPKEPVKAGGIFTGWYKDEECTTLWDFATDTVTEDIILYAGWDIDPNFYITVTFKMADSVDQHIYTVIGAKLEKDDCPNVTGEDQNWYMDEECKNPWDFETDELRHNMVLYSVGHKDNTLNDEDDVEEVDNEDKIVEEKPLDVVPTVDPHADDRTVIVKQKMDISGLFDTTKLGKDEKIAGYRVVENKKVASINNKGVILPKKPGEVVVEAFKVVKENKKKEKVVVSSVKLTVVKPAFDKKLMTGFVPGQKVDITKCINMPINQKVQWKASKSSAATMDENGIVTVGNKSGKLVVTAIFTNKDGKKVKIKGKLIVKLPKLSKRKLIVKTGKSAKLSVKNLVDPEKQKIEWKTSDTAIAKYNEADGIVTGVKEGQAVITAVINGVEYKCDVTVKASK